MSQYQLRERLQQVQAAAARRDTDILLMLDSSKTIPHHHFRLMQDQAKKLVASTLSKHTRIAVMTFSHRTWLAPVFLVNESSQETINSAIDSLQKLDKGSNWWQALKFASIPIIKYGRPGAAKLVLLFTNGMPNNQNTAELAGLRLRNMGATIIGVYIDAHGMPENIQKVERVCGGPGTVYHLHSFNDLKGILENHLPPAEPEEEIALQFEQLVKPVAFAESVPITVKVRNCGVSPAIPNDTTLVVDGKGFWRNATQPLNETVTISNSTLCHVLLVPNQGVDIEDMPDHVGVTLTHKSRTDPYYAKAEGFDVEMHCHVGDIIGYRPKSSTTKRANMLVFGPAGNGKSTLINALISLAYEDYQAKAIANGAQTHVTRKTDVHAFEQNAGFAFIDTFGLTKENYQSGDLEAIVQGALPIGYDMDHCNDVNKLVAVHQKTKKHRAVHAVLLVMTQGTRFEQPESLAHLNGYIDKIRKMGLEPVLAVTYMDEVADAEHGEVQATMHKLTGIAEADIYLIDNSNPEAKRFSDQKALYMLMRKLFARADGFLSSGSIGLCAGAGAAEVDHELIVARYKGKEHVETAHLFLEQPADEIFLTKLRTEIRRQLELQHFVFLRPGDMTRVLGPTEHVAKAPSIAAADTEARPLPLRNTNRIVVYIRDH